MYAGLALVVLGLVRLVWSKRGFLRSSPRILGPISLPHGTPNSSDNEALPYIRPDTPGGSRPSTPFNGSPNVDGRSQPNRPGLLYYLPVWVMPPGDRGHGSATSPNPADANWSQYFSNLSFVDSGDQANRYHPIPSFSRPPSPSNNSILHAPGATHDGAFDGVQLHSIQGPQPTRSSNSVPTSSTSPLPPSTSGPNSPPAYSTLRSVGANLFRPFHSVASKESGEDFDPEHPPTSFERVESKLVPGRSNPGSASSSSHRHSVVGGGTQLRPRSPASVPLPPQYASPPTDGRPHPVSFDFGHGYDSRSASPTPQGASTPKPAASTEHGTEFSRSSEARRDEEKRNDESFLDDALGEFESDYEVEIENGRRGVPLEEEVDRLLNEMSPDSNLDLEKGEFGRR